MAALAGLGGLGQLGALGNLGNLNPTAAAAAMQAFQQQLFRGIQQGLSASNLNNLQAQMMHFSPLIYSYQLAMAQAAALSAAGKGGGGGGGSNSGGSGSSSGAGVAPSIAEMQRVMELQRQYQEMMPQSGPSQNRQSNWKS